MTDKKRMIAIIVAAILGVAALLYLGGLSSQLLSNYDAWLNDNGLSGQATMQPVNWSPLTCLPLAFTGNGIKGMLLLIGICGAIFLYVKFHDKFDSKQRDPRGFTTSKSGLYGSASWMTDQEMKEMLEVSPIEKAEGTILGEYKGKAVCMPVDTRLNRHPISVDPTPVEKAPSAP